jgi:hypothetical protein
LLQFGLYASFILAEEWGWISTTPNNMATTPTIHRTETISPNRKYPIIPLEMKFAVTELEVARSDVVSLSEAENTPTIAKLLCKSVLNQSR